MKKYCVKSVKLGVVYIFICYVGSEPLAASSLLPLKKWEAAGNCFKLFWSNFIFLHLLNNLSAVQIKRKNRCVYGRSTLIGGTRTLRCRERGLLYQDSAVDSMVHLDL